MSDQETQKDAPETSVETDQDAKDQPTGDQTIDSQSIDDAVMPDSEDCAEQTAQDRIAALEADLAKANENVLRALADAENTRTRTRRDLEAARKFAVEPLAKELLNALDHLGRARGAVNPKQLDGDETLKNLHVGVEMTEKELLKAFEKFNIQQLSPAGEVFDPNVHQALQHVEGTDADAGTVVEVVAPGYTMHDRLLRAAMVLVAK